MKNWTVVPKDVIIKKNAVHFFEIKLLKKRHL